MLWQESLRELAYSISLYSNTSLRDALELEIEFAQQFFDSKSFQDRRKNSESELKIQVAVLDRLDGVIKAIGGLGKAMASVFRNR